MATTEHLNIPTYEQFDEHLRLMGLLAAGNASSDAMLDSIVTASCTGENTTRLFWAWYMQAQDGTKDRYELLSRFFSALAKGWADKTYTLRQYAHAVSGSDELTPLDDLAGKTAAPLMTENDADSFHWMDEDPMYWYIRANALSKQDGTMNVLAIEGEDAFDITGELAPVYTFKMAKWYKHWEDGTYIYKSWRTSQQSGFEPYAGDVGFSDNKKRALTWEPTFPGGLNSAGGLTSGAGIAPYINVSAAAGITTARKTSAYEGLWNDCDTIAALTEWQFRHFTTENSNIVEGCTNYNIDYTPAVAETGVERVLVTVAQGANIIKGSCMQLSATARGGTVTFGPKQVKSVETVTVDGTQYAAVNIDNGGTTFDVTTDLHLCSMPWFSGATEALPGHKDGAIFSLAGGKAPIRVGGVEYMHGAYDIGLDPLYNVTAATDGVSTHKDYEVYECRDSEKLATSITGNYKSTGIVLANVAQSWSYVKEFFIMKLGVLFPKTFGGSSTQWYKSAFVGSSSAGVRCPWRFADLGASGLAGLACEHGAAAPSNAGWYSRPRLSGAGKKRGEWAA